MSGKSAAYTTAHGLNAPPTATLAAIAPSELFVSYEAGAPGYWRVHRTLGQNISNPVVVEAYLAAP